MTVEGDLDALELAGRVTVALDPPVPVGLDNVEPMVPRVAAPGAPRNVELDDEESVHDVDVDVLPAVVVLDGAPVSMRALVSM